MAAPAKDNPSTEIPSATIFLNGTNQTFLKDRGAPPPWRSADRDAYRGLSHVVTNVERQAIEAAFYLRRPLLVTGDPGVGKSSLAYAIASELNLGKVLVWPITSRTSLQQGLYSYDAVGRLNQVSLASEAERKNRADDAQIKKYLRLGPLGTALADSADEKPRVLLVDELDKSDIDLPNDLLHVLEEGSFIIPELARLSLDKISIPMDIEGDAEISNGRVHYQAAPFILITSNGEREFSPAFLRRCLQLKVELPSADALREIVLGKLRELAPKTEDLDKILNIFVEQREQKKSLATDQLINAALLLAQGRAKADQKELERLLFKPLQ